MRRLSVLLPLLMASAIPADARVTVGASYAGTTSKGGSVVFAVSADRRIADITFARVHGKCMNEPSLIGAGGLALKVARDGRFHGAYLDSTQLTVRGRLLANGRASGTMSYYDRGDCSATASFSARVERRATGTGPRLFTLAGGDSTVTTPGAPATRRRFLGAGTLAERPGGSIVFPDSSTDGYLREVTTDGRLRTLAGRAGRGSSGDGGPATAAGLDDPEDVAVLPDGSLLIAEPAANCIREIGPDGIIRTVAGRCDSLTGQPGFAGDGGPATAARLFYPIGLAALPNGGFLIADLGNERVRKVSAAGVITTVAGTGTAGFSGDGGPATVAEISRPGDVLAEPGGGFLVSDELNQRVRRVSAHGTISTAAGGGTPSALHGIGENRPARQGVVIDPGSLAATPGGGFLFTDLPLGRVRAVSAAGVLTTRIGGGPSTGPGARAVDAHISGYANGVLRTREGGTAVSADGFILYAPPARTHWLLAALRPNGVIARHGHRAGVTVLTTRAALLTVDVLGTHERLIVRVRVRTRRNTTAVRLPAGLARGHYRLRVTARDGARITTAPGRLTIR